MMGPVCQVASAGLGATRAAGGGGVAMVPQTSGITSSGAASSRLQHRVAGPYSGAGGCDAGAASVLDVLLATQQDEARMRATALAKQDPATVTAADYQNLLLAPVVAFREVSTSSLPPPASRWGAPQPPKAAAMATATAASTTGAAAMLTSSSCGGPLPEDWVQLASAHGCRHFAAVGISTSADDLKGVFCLASTAASRPASWTPEALHAVAALLAAHVAQAAAVLSEALPALHAATNISQVVAALGAAAASEADKIAHVCGQVRVAFVHHLHQQQQAPAGEAGLLAAGVIGAAASAAVFPYEGGPGAGDRKSSLSASQAPPSTPSALRVRRRASCELIMDRDRTGLLQVLQARGSSVMQQAAAAQVEDGSVGSLAAALYSAATTAGATTMNGSAAARNQAIEALPPKPLSNVGPSGVGGDNSLTELESADSIRRMLSFVNGSREGNTATGFVRFSSCADAASVPVAGTCKGHTLALAGTLLAEALSKGAAGLCVDDCAAHVQDTKSYPRDLVLSRNAPMPLSLALATSTASSLALLGSNDGLLRTTDSACTSAFAPGMIARAPYLEAPDACGAGAQAAVAAASLFAGVGGGAASTSADGRPLVALYATFAQPMPRPLLQAVVRSLRELLTAVEPIVISKMTRGDLMMEWQHMKAELQHSQRGKGGGGTPDTTFAELGRSLSFQPDCVPENAVVGGGCGGLSGPREEDASVFDTFMTGLGGATTAAIAAVNGSRAGGPGGGGGGGLMATGGTLDTFATAIDAGTLGGEAAAGGAVVGSGGPLDDDDSVAMSATSVMTGGPGTGGGGGGAGLALAAFLNNQVPPAGGSPSRPQRPAAAEGTAAIEGSLGSQTEGRPPRNPLLKRLFITNGGSPMVGGGSGNGMSPTAAAAAAAAAAAGGQSAFDVIAGSLTPPRGSTPPQQASPMIPSLQRFVSACSSSPGAAGPASVRPQASAEGVAGGASSSAHYPRRAVALRSRSVSFRLEAAESPRGASKLAPIISIMHERLKAAQAVQMMKSAADARQSDIDSVILLQEVGRGGYGIVFRAKYHGSEVAVKVIQEMQVTPAAVSTKSKTAGGAGKSGGTGSGPAGSGGRAPASVALHKQNLHDAIELVASVSISHPNIVQVLTFFTDCRLEGGSPQASGDYVDTAAPMPRLVHAPATDSDIDDPEASSMALVMEYCDAGCLSDAIVDGLFLRQLQPTTSSNGDPNAKRKPMLAISFRSVMLTLLEVALALRHMHSLHLVHCDLKPQNVLLKSNPRDSRGFTAKLSDFGLAKTMAHDEQGHLVIDEAVASGTITHVAPEVFMGQRPLGAAVDIFAFGILMHQIVAGVRLYEGLTAQQIADAVSHEGLRPRMPSWVPSNYRALAERCWHALPSARPTADELVRQLERLGAGTASSTSKSRLMRPQSGYSQFAN
ncbi:hypothetical protein HYH02_007103 [Chlamydomonas schloesseri]|uniref:Protein kinase domain-containing protein n=1 Tax=Chlamydomonas schloesseri TaxID=2026947 RepID=A0A835WIB0_9CHLO|nr:hypothetical protein HYH02_007103 [Chlamydomonas schloesseri]|eukprot:KAG2448078.1 hypothetical protein HYH02_007103 [Chlamydomonas schloesseri]